MKNIEKYQEQLAKWIIDNIKYDKSGDKYCEKKHCNNCEQKEMCDQFYSIEQIKRWFFEEYKQPIKLTEDEKVILRNLPKKYEYIARDYNGSLYLYTKKPQKIVDTDYWGTIVKSTSKIFNIYKHLFKFIAEPYNIEELLKEK